MTQAAHTHAPDRNPPHGHDAEHPWRYTAQLAQKIESRWQAHWETHNTFRTLNPGERGFDPTKPGFYVLDMFPYPSGVGLHVGHPLGYIATDIIARYKRMTGHNVLHPMGFDAFGLPAEQFAVEHGVHPRITTEQNMRNMVRQLKQLGLSYDWTRQLATIEPGYYGWTQWIFLKLFNAWFDHRDNKAKDVNELISRYQAGERTDDGRLWSDLSPIQQREVIDNKRLAYIAEIPVNWCPALGTVLANEEVTADGRSERGNHPVYKRPMRQWMLRITAYAERLASDLSLVDWPEPIKMMQRNWIGRSEGARINFSLQDRDDVITVFTTRPDTIFGATYMVLAPEHPLVDSITTAAQRDAVKRYQHETASRTDVDRMAETKKKTGVFTGAHAINPATNATIPVWIADYVLMGYGTGAIMAVPGQDQRDWDFAKVFNLPIIRTVQPPPDFRGEAYFEDGPAINSAFLNGLHIAQAKMRIIEWLEQHNHGQSQVQYKLRDWLFSRQRYWGEPFPIVHGPDGEVRAIDESLLPVTLPEMEDFKPTASNDPDSPPLPPLSRTPESWRILTIGGVQYRRELNTMPQWAGSCWYYLRFLDPHNTRQFVAPDIEQYWMKPNGVDLYVGGVEHAVLHLLYSRFWHKVLFDLGHVSTPEPFGKLFNQGYIQAYCYRDERGVVVEATEVVTEDGRPASESQGQKDARFFHNGKPVTEEYGKMGKSLKNAVAPDDVCADYGCDSLRLYEMYLGPLEQSKPWATRDIVGVFRFLQRVWRMVVNEQTNQVVLLDSPIDLVERSLHQTIARVGEHIERFAFNTAIASMIEFTNTAIKNGGVTRSQLERFALILAPFAPHMAEELWSRLGHTHSLGWEPWPKYDPAMLLNDTIEIPVQILGKMKGKVSVPADADTRSVEAAALADKKIAALLAGKSVRKVIVVPGKIINIMTD